MATVTFIEASSNLITLHLSDGLSKIQFYIEEFQSCCENFGINVWRDVSIDPTERSDQPLDYETLSDEWMGKSFDGMVYDSNAEIAFNRRNGEDNYACVLLKIGGVDYPVHIYNIHNGYYAHSYHILGPDPFKDIHGSL